MPAANPIQEPVVTNPNDPTGGTGTGGTTTALAPFTPPLGSGLVIQAYEAIGTATGSRVDLPSTLVGPCNWVIEPLGGYSTFDLTLLKDVHTQTFPAIPAGARFDAWKDGIRLFRGYAVDSVLSEDTGNQTKQISGYGRFQDLDNLVLQGNYQYPQSVDISQVFSDIGADIQGRFPDIVMVSEFVGVKTNNVDAYRKTAREVLAALYDLISSVATLGMDVEPATGKDRLYLRVKATTATHSFSIPGQATGRRSRALKLSDLVNVVHVQGDEPDYPQMLPNPSFEFSNRLGEGGLNLVENGSFEDGSGSVATGWTFANGAARKQSDVVQAHTGAVQASVAQLGQYVSQTDDTPPLALVAGHDYNLSFWYRPELQATIADPPKVEARLWWRKSDGSSYSAITTQAASAVQAYQQYQLTARCPSDVVGYQVQFVHVGGSTGNNKGAMIDDVALYDNSQLSPQFWDFRVFGSAQVNTANWRAGGAFHGRNCLYVDATASDTNGQDVAIRCTPSYRFNVVAGQQLRYGMWLKTNAGETAPVLMRQIQFFNQEGTNQNAAVKVYINPSGPWTAWTYFETIMTVPHLAVTAEAWLNIRGSGRFYLDAISVRVAADNGTVFLDTGNLFCSFRADELVSYAEDPDVNQSIARYGLREKTVIISGIKSIADARAAAKTFLLNYASDVPAPVVDVYDYDRFVWVGDAVQLIGPDAAKYADRTLPLARINGSINDKRLVTHGLELKRVQKTQTEIYAAMAKRSATRLLITQGAQAAALPTGGTVSGGIDDGS